MDRGGKRTLPSTWKREDGEHDKSGFIAEEEFIDVLEDTIVEEQTNIYKSIVLKSAWRKSLKKIIRPFSRKTWKEFNATKKQSEREIPNLFHDNWDENTKICCHLCWIRDSCQLDA
jgi:hypothetical protein